MSTYNRWKTVEVALLLAAAVTLVWGASSLGRQDALQEKMIRLHVIANSDSAEDQAMKLTVRDAVLSRAEALLREAEDLDAARRDIQNALPELEQAAAESCGGAYPVAASLEMAEFPRKEYDGFALPAGEYLALRVVIGEGAGRNWWCVVYPPLCTTAACSWQETAAAGGLEDGDIRLMAETEQGYVLRFRAVELWETLRQWLGKG